LWRRVLQHASAGCHALGVGARSQKSKVAPSLERRRRTHRIELALSPQDCKFVARPARSAVTEPRLRVEEVATGTRSLLGARLLPKRQPLARMAVAHALGRGH